MSALVIKIINFTLLMILIVIIGPKLISFLFSLGQIIGSLIRYLFIVI